MLPEEFDYPLPQESITQRPNAERGASRMMLLRRDSRTFEDRRFAELPEILLAGDLLVFNTRGSFQHNYWAGGRERARNPSTRTIPPRGST